ncbi:MAG: pyridoxal phosphate-dependent aminotransferase [Syntrophobacterales bacterium]|nr:pyridoxal phosphate-dependent aminotransferase [Syntrophobacterales bacterium]
MKFAKRVERIKPSPTLAITAKANALRAEGRDIINFGAGEPDFDTPVNIREAAVSSIRDGFTRYTPVGGIDELKDAIIKKFQRDNQLIYKRSEIVVSCGAKHVLYNLAQALFDEGDEVIIPSPYWVSYPDIVLLSGAVPSILEAREAEGFKITPDQLKAAINKKTRAIVLNSPSNPTGSTYTFAELKDLAEVIVEKNILVISDEIYEKIIYDKFPFSSIAMVNEDVKRLSIVVNGVSKSYAMTGWRIGYAAGPENIISAMTKIQSQNTSNPTSIAQKAVVEALNGDQSATGEMVEAFSERRNYIIDALNEMEDISCMNPDGAFYAFPDVSSLYGRVYNGKTVKDSTSLAEYFLDVANVAVVPGIAFGNDKHIRLSYATSMENIREGITRIENAVKNLK